MRTVKGSIMQRWIRMLVLSLACAAGVAVAADYPDRSVRLIVPFPPGGGTDTLGRVLGAKLAEQWGQQVIIDNRGGAQGNVGTAMGAKARLTATCSLWRTRAR